MTIVILKVCGCYVWLILAGNKSGGNKKNGGVSHCEGSKRVEDVV